MRALKHLMAMALLIMSLSVQAEEWVAFKNDGLNSMVDTASIKKYPGLVYAVTRVSLTKDLMAYHQIYYACASKTLYFTAPTTTYPDSDERPKPTTPFPEESDNLHFNIKQYCQQPNSSKDNVELPIAMSADDTQFETFLAKETSIKGDNIYAWTTMYSVSKSLAYKMKDRDRTPVYNYKINHSNGYMLNHIEVNCTNRTLRLLASHKYDKSGKVISSITEPKSAIPTIPKSHGRYVADFLCTFVR